MCLQQTKSHVCFARCITINVSECCQYFGAEYQYECEEHSKLEETLILDRNDYFELKLKFNQFFVKKKF